MATLRVVRDAKLAGITAASANSWAEPVSEKLAALLEPFLEPGENMPDVVLLQKLVGRLLASRRQSLEKVDQRNLDAVATARQYRRRRDEAAQELREVLRTARFYLEQKQGRGAGAQYGIGNGLSYMSPDLLARTGAHIATCLESFQRVESSPLPSILAVDQLIAAVSEKTAALEAALAKLRPQNHRENFSRAQKDKSVAATEKAVRHGAAFLSGLYQLCEFEGLAERVRPVFRRRRRKGGGKEEKGTAGTSGTAGTAGTAGTLEIATGELEAGERPEQAQAPPLRLVAGARKGAATHSGSEPAEGQLIGPPAEKARIG